MYSRSSDAWSVIHLCLIRYLLEPMASQNRSLRLIIHISMSSPKRTSRGTPEVGLMVRRFGLGLSRNKENLFILREVRQKQY